MICIIRYIEHQSVPCQHRIGMLMQAAQNIQKYKIFGNASIKKHENEYICNYFYL